MKKVDIQVGGHYRAKVNGRLTTVRVDGIRTGPRFVGADKTSYDVTNLATGKRTVFRSAQKFIAPAPDPSHPSGSIRAAAGRPEGDDSPDPTVPAATAAATAGNTTSPTTPNSGASLPDRPLAEKEVSKPTNGTTDNPIGLVSAPKSGTGPAAVPFADWSAKTSTPDEPELAGLAGDQPAAFRAVTERLADGQPVVKLTGYAGTGKTFLTARVASWALRNHDRYRKVTVVAPTHKAAGVIEEKLAGAGVPVGDGKGAVDVRTIHSLLGLRLEPDMENDTGGRILLATEKKEKPKGLVICDEASMVGSVLKEHVERAAEVQWLFVGDLAQLSPVGEGVSELLDNPDAELRTVLRQAKGSEILNLATRIREGDLSTEFEAGRDVHKVGSAEDLFQAALAVFNTDAYRADAGHARMLVFKNLRRQAINRRMRDLLVGAEEPYVAGEWLVMYAAFCPERSKLNLMAERAREYSKGTREYSRAWRNFFEFKERHSGDNVTRLHVSEEVQVVDATDGEVKVGGEPFKVYRLAVRARGEVFDLPVLQAPEVTRARKIMDELTQTALQLRKERDEQPERSPAWERLDKERRQAWSFYFTMEEIFAQVDYAYAMTVHKSQGSTFTHAFVDVPDLLSAGGMQQRILYTACTRPAKSLTFYR